jgi:siroheme synthase
LDDTALDWEHLAAVDTLVILMGLGRLPTIADRLVEAGRSPDLPVAVVAAGTTDAQQVVRGTLDTIGGRLGSLEPPATIVVGEVARWSDVIDWFDAAPGTDEAFPMHARVRPAPEASGARAPALPQPAVSA